MRAHLAAHVQREFHFVERTLKIGGGDSADHDVAFVADDVGLITSDDAGQTAATGPKPQKVNCPLAFAGN